MVFQREKFEYLSIKYPVFRKDCHHTFMAGLDCSKSKHASSENGPDGVTVVGLG